MRKILCFVIIFALLFSLASCSEVPSSLEVMLDLKYIGKISGEVYSSLAAEGDEHYIDSDLENMLFFGERAPENYAVILSPFIDLPHEVLLIIPMQGEDEGALYDLARRRLALLLSSPDARPEMTGDFIAYSTLDIKLDLVDTVEKIISGT
jgi:hypothetical protein